MAEILFVTCHITDVMKNVLVFFTTDYFIRQMHFSVFVSWSVSSANIGFGHHMPHKRYRLPFISTLYSLRKTCFDTNVGYVCHMTACIIFVGMFVVIGSVSYVV